MKDIKECAQLYQTLCNKVYAFRIEGGISFQITFTTKNFHHLLGLHKLKDIPALVINKPLNSAAKIYEKILNGDIAAGTVKRSIYYNKISDRIENFEKILETLDKNKCKIIIDFDSTKIKNCKLKQTKYILYTREASGYFLFTLGAVRRNMVYPETVMFEPSAKYTDNQTFLDVYSIEEIQAKRSKKQVV